MTDLLPQIDSYYVKARVYPALITLLPPLIALVAWFPSLLTENIGITLVTLVSSCGVLYALGVFARTAGRHEERRLLRQWGGWPTTIWLRHSSAHLTATTRERYHKFLVGHVSGLSLPSVQQEAQDPVQADAAYASGVEWLKEKCRGKDFPLVEKENAEYGFRRNLRGLKRFGIGAAVATIAAVLVGASSDAFSASPLAPRWSFDLLASNLSTPVRGALVLNILAVVGSLMVVKDSWVREAGDHYARALLANCDGLALATPRPK